MTWGTMKITKHNKFKNNSYEPIHMIEWLDSDYTTCRACCQYAMGNTEPRYPVPALYGVSKEVVR